MCEPEPEAESTIVRRLIGVYNAEGTVLGELAYFFGSRLGRAHCSLCDITHGAVREKSEWQACRRGLPVPFATYHRNDQPGEVRSAAAQIAPVVVAQTDGGMVVLLEPDALSACAGSVAELTIAIHKAMHRFGLSWPTMT